MGPAERGGARPIGEAVAEYLKASGLARRMKQGPLLAAWEETIGAAWAAHARVCGFHRNILNVEVDSAAMLQELAGFRKAEILAALNEALDGVRVANIKFQLGDFSARA